MRKPILKDQREREALRALATMFTKADRVLSGDPVNVVVQHNCPVRAPAWTDGNVITFNGDMLDSLTDAETLVRIFGLNYHELAHQMFTPRVTYHSTFGKALISENLKFAFNVLEDQRIETLLTGLYPSTIPYLVSTFMRYCATNKQTWELNYPLVYGRRFIPADVRREFRRRFQRQEIIPQLEAVIDEYRLLVFPNDEDRALDLIREYHWLMQTSGAPTPSDPNGHSEGRPDVDKGKADGARKQKQAADAAAELDEALADAEAEDDSEDTDAETGDTASDGTADDGQETDQSGTSASSDGESDDDGEGESEGGSESLTGTGDVDDLSDLDGDANDDAPADVAKGSGAGLGSSEELTDDELQDLMDDVISQAESDSDLTSEIESAQRTVSGGTNLDSELPRKVGIPNEQVGAEDIVAARRFAAVLEQLRMDVDAGWNRGVSSGRLNIKRVIEGGKYDEVWDRWEPGHNDATDIECVILIDTSISMRYRIDSASRALWVIKRALEKVNADVSVFSFSGDAHTIYKRGERTSPDTYRAMQVSGGTIPHRAVREAVRVLDSSKRTTRLFIAITDGDWEVTTRGYYRWDDMSPDDMIAAMNKTGVTTALCYIAPPWDRPAHIPSHNCQVVTAVEDPFALIGFAKQVVNVGVKATIQNERY